MSLFPCAFLSFDVTEEKVKYKVPLTLPVWDHHLPPWCGDQNLLCKYELVYPQNEAWGCEQCETPEPGASSR